MDLALPPVCAACGGALAGEAALCAACDAKLPRLPPDRCLLCQAVAVAAPGCCEACREAGSPLAAAIAAVSFTGPVVDWIHRFKYPAPGLAGLDPAPLAVVRSLACEAARRVAGPPAALVVPVPLHARRLRQRGFNPALLLARAVARAVGARVAPTAMRRLRDTPSQTGLDRRARRRNVQGAFSARTSAPRVILVDDVVTTGATLSEAAAALRRAGVREVVAICVARA